LDFEKEKAILETQEEIPVLFIESRLKKNGIIIRQWDMPKE
jgi:hypothetical protein